MEYYFKEGQENFYELLKRNITEDKEEFFYTIYEFQGEARKDVKLTRQEVLDKSLSIAKSLKERGAKKGDRIVVLATQTEDNLLSVTASLLGGTVFTIIPPPIDASKMARFISVIKSCKPRFIMCGTLLEDTLKKILAGLAEEEKDINEIQVVNVEKCLDNKGFIPEKIGLDDIIYIQYTSGSTSAPKGVMVSYGNLLSAIECSMKKYNVRSVFSWVPFFHNLGLIYSIFIPIIKPEIKAGVMSTKAFLDKPERWIKLLSESKAEVTLAPNSVYDMYPKLVPASTVGDIDLSNIKLLLNGSEIIRESTIYNFVNEYKGFGITMDTFCNGYGLSEVTCSAADYIFSSEKDILKLDFQEYKKKKLKLADENTKETISLISSGGPIYKMLMKIVNPDTLEECKEDEFGEIWMQSPYVAQGYYNNEEATKGTFQGELKGYDGYFLRTGDLGILKNDRIFITGRIKELIIINGNNILPNDITSKLKETIVETEYADIVPFSVVRDKKEKLVLVLGIPNKLLPLIDKEQVKNKINEVILENFEITPYDIKFVEGTKIPKADSGKISISATAKKYEESASQMTSEKVVDYKTVTESKLGNIIAEKFSHKAGRTDNLLNLGMDSLEVVRLSRIIENVFKVNIPIVFIFQSPYIENISQYIDRSLNGEDLSLLEKDKSYLYDEVKLPESIRPEEYKCDEPEMKNVFITGTTGFVGAYLISSFAKFTNANLYCHVRAKNKDEGLNRIKKNMEFYHLWKEEYKEIIKPITGSLNEELLGIDKKEYKFLAENIDTIIHNGALLNFIYPYETLKETNVLGTVRTLALACEGKPKFYNYVSSYSVFDNPSHFKEIVKEDDELKDCMGYYLSYSESKWVAENIIHEARKRGLKAAIYRPGEITGANDIGIWKLSDSISRTIKSMLVTKTYPDVPLRIHMTQVDYIADAIVTIAKDGQSYGKAFNLMNDTFVTLKWLANVMGEMGYEINEISYEEWKSNLLNSGDEHPLKLLESLFKVQKKNDAENFLNRYGEMSPIYEDRRNVQEALAGTKISCESMNSQLLKKYIYNFIN